MAPTVGIFVYTTNEVYRANPSVINPALDLIADYEGSKGYVERALNRDQQLLLISTFSIYHGVQVEDQKTGYLFVGAFTRSNASWI